jgi:hypothetical protein
MMAASTACRQIPMNPPEETQIGIAAADQARADGKGRAHTDPPKTAPSATAAFRARSAAIVVEVRRASQGNVRKS